MGTGGEYLDLLDPNDEIFWKEAGLYLPNDALRDKFGQGGSKVPGGIDSSRRYQGGALQPGKQLSSEQHVERDLLAIIDDCQSADLNIPRENIQAASHFHSKPNYLTIPGSVEKAGVRAVGKP